MKANLYKTLFLVLIGLVILSCKKENTEPASLVGTWTYVTATTVTTPKPSGAQTTKTYTYTPNALKVTFNADGTQSEAYQGGTTTGTYTYSGTTLTRYGGPTSAAINNVYNVTALTSSTLVFTTTDVDSYGSYFRTFNLTR